MILTYDDWKFSVDIDATMAYSAAEAADHCTCDYCRNFYGAVDGAFPQLRGFLGQFGLDVEAPEELMPFTATQMLAKYLVTGQILSYGKRSIDSCGTPISAEPYEAERFLLSVGPFEIPWVLEEPLVESEIVSPANQPSFLRNMWNYLLKNGEKPKIWS